MARLLCVILALSLFIPSAVVFAQTTEPEFVWVTSESSATRFPEPTSGEVEKTTVGDKLQVVFREGDRIRLRFKGSTFGWVDTSTVSSSEPTGPTETP